MFVNIYFDIILLAK